MSALGLVRTATLAVSALSVSFAKGSAGPEAWPGVDDAVVGRFAREAGLGPSPVIDWVHGDALLFAFLSAGLVAGFVLGFVGRGLFVSSSASTAASSPRQTRHAGLPSAASTGGSSREASCGGRATPPLLVAPLGGPSEAATMHELVTTPESQSGAPVHPRAPERRLFAALVAIVVAVASSSLAVVAALAPFPCAVLCRPGARSRFGRRLLGIGLVGVPAVVLRTLAAHPATSGGVVTAEGIHAGALTALRILVAAAWAFWLTETLDAEGLENALRRVGVPPAVVELVGLTHRFASQFGRTLSSAWAAASLRGGVSSADALGRTTGLVAGVVVTRALDRAERVAVARALRGYGGTAP